MSTPHGRNRAPRVEKDRSRRWGPLTAETAIVLGVAAAIVAGAFLVEAVQPAAERTNTISGKDTIEIHQVGKGGVQPGALQRRTIVQQPVKPVVVPTATPTTTAKPGKTPKPRVTAAPTQDVPGSGPNLPGQGGGGNDGGPLCGILGNCPDNEPEPEQTPDPEPTEGTEATPAPTTDTESNTTSKTDTASAKKKKKPTPSPEPASPR